MMKDFAKMRALVGGGSGSGGDYTLTDADKQEIAELVGDSTGGIDVSGASVGQTIQVAAVDENGKPTAWSPVDFPSGGGSSEEEWQMIADNVLEEETNRLEFSFSAMKKVRVLLDTEAASADTNVSSVSIDSYESAAQNSNVTFRPKAVPTKDKASSLYEVEYIEVDGVPYCKATWFYTPEQVPYEANKSFYAKDVIGGSVMFRPLNAYNQPVLAQIVKITVATYATFAVGTKVKVMGVAK